MDRSSGDPGEILGDVDSKELKAGYTLNSSWFFCQCVQQSKTLVHAPTLRNSPDRCKHIYCMNVDFGICSRSSYEYRVFFCWIVPCIIHLWTFHFTVFTPWQESSTNALQFSSDSITLIRISLFSCMVSQDPMEFPQVGSIRFSDGGDDLVMLRVVAALAEHIVLRLVWEMNTSAFRRGACRRDGEQENKMDRKQLVNASDSHCDTVTVFNLTVVVPHKSQYNKACEGEGLQISHTATLLLHSKQIQDKHSNIIITIIIIIIITITKITITIITIIILTINIIIITTTSIIIIITIAKITITIIIFNTITIIILIINLTINSIIITIIIITIIIFNSIIILILTIINSSSITRITIIIIIIILTIIIIIIILILTIIITLIITIITTITKITIIILTVTKSTINITITITIIIFNSIITITIIILITNIIITSITSITSIIIIIIIIISIITIIVIITTNMLGFLSCF
ncbi:hypothetical protein C0J45_22313 [Silurus meridionalis]|nr:hypothetical protein C0J45_22313 [Silurus meridionalis]